MVVSESVVGSGDYTYEVDENWAKIPEGWDMPAAPLFNALNEHARKRVVISDVKEPLTPEAVKAGVLATDTYIDYFLR